MAVAFLVLVDGMQFCSIGFQLNINPPGRPLWILGDVQHLQSPTFTQQEALLIPIPNMVLGSFPAKFQSGPSCYIEDAEMTWNSLLVFSQSFDLPHFLLSNFEFQMVLGKPHLPGRNQIFAKLKSKIGGQEWWCMPTSPALRRQRWASAGKQELHSI